MSYNTKPIPPPTVDEEDRKLERGLLDVSANVDLISWDPSLLRDNCALRLTYYTGSVVVVQIGVRVHPSVRARLLGKTGELERVEVRNSQD